MKKKKVVAKRGNTLPSTINMRADATMGSEGADASSYAIPFLTVLQALSPQITDETVKGAKAGLFINTITDEMQESVLIIPCGFQRKYLRWVDREQGGGFKGQYSAIEVESGRLKGITTNEKGMKMIEGDYLNDTRIHYVLMQTKNGSWKPVVISLTSSQIKRSKQWMSLISGIEIKDKSHNTLFNPPSFSHIYKLTKVKEKNEKGTWWGYNFEINQIVDDPLLYEAARKFCIQVNEGIVQTVDPVPEGDAEPSKKGF